MAPASSRPAHQEVGERTEPGGDGQEDATSLDAVRARGAALSRSRTLATDPTASVPICRAPMRASAVGGVGPEDPVAAEAGVALELGEGAGGVGPEDAVFLARRRSRAC